MKNKHLLACLGLVLSAAPLFAAGETIEIRADHTNALYACGEPAAFSVAALGADRKPLAAGTLRIDLRPCSTQAVRTFTFDLAKTNHVVVSGTLTEPGFLKCLARLSAGTVDVCGAAWGVGFDPERIVAGSERPADFDAFWDGAMKKLAREVPLDPRVTPITNGWSDAAFDGYRVSFATFGGARVHGFLTVPRNRRPGQRFPVRVSVPGAGSGAFLPDTEPGSITLLMIVHPYEVPMNREGCVKLYVEQSKRLDAKWHTGEYTYFRAGIAGGRETYFYYPVILGINRAVDWLATRPDVDLTRFTYFAGSQGGAFGFFLCGLNRHFTKGVMCITAMSDHSGALRGRDPGWPDLIARLPKADQAAGARWAPYFDAAHFAPRITCPVRVSVGFIDTTCPPCAVYASYNALRVKDKAIINDLGIGHDISGPARARLDAWRRAR